MFCLWSDYWNKLTVCFHTHEAMPSLVNFLPAMVNCILAKTVDEINPLSPKLLSWVFHHRNETKDRYITNLRKISFYFKSRSPSPNNELRTPPAWFPSTSIHYLMHAYPIFFLFLGIGSGGVCHWRRVKEGVRKKRQLIFAKHSNKHRQIYFIWAKLSKYRNLQQLKVWDYFWELLNSEIGSCAHARPTLIGVTYTQILEKICMRLFTLLFVFPFCCI